MIWSHQQTPDDFSQYGSETGPKKSIFNLQKLCMNINWINTDDLYIIDIWSSWSGSRKRSASLLIV